jgi:predicted RNase H-like HicB family nuclease
MLSIYPACFFKEDNGYSVIFPDLNYLATQGDTLEDAVAMAVDCLAGYLYTAKMDNEKFPKASKLSDINIDRLSDELDITGTYTDAFTNMVSVDVKAYAKEHFDKPLPYEHTRPPLLHNGARFRRRSIGRNARGRHNLYDCCKQFYNHFNICYFNALNTAY